MSPHDIVFVLMLVVVTPLCWLRSIRQKNGAWSVPPPRKTEVPR